MKTDRNNPTLDADQALQADLMILMWNKLRTKLENISEAEIVLFREKIEHDQAHMREVRTRLAKRKDQIAEELFDMGCWCDHDRFWGYNS